MPAFSQNTWGYIVSLAGFVTFAGCLAPINSYGRIFTAIQDDMNTTSVQTGWIGSVTWCVSFLSSPLAVMIVRIAGSRVTAVIAAFAVSGAYLATSFMKNYIGMLVCYGVLVGATAGLLVHIIYSTILKTFTPSHHSRGASLAACGASVGTLFVATAYEKLVASLGWRRTLQITSVYCAILAVPASFFLTPHDNDTILERKTSTVPIKAEESVYSISEQVKGPESDANMSDMIDQPKHKRWLRLLFMWRSWLLFFGIMLPAMSWSVYWVNIISFYESISVPADDIFLHVTIQTFSDLSGRIFLFVFGTCLTHVHSLVIVSHITLVCVTAALAAVPTRPVLLFTSVIIGVGRGWFNIHPITASVDLLQVADSDQAVSVALVALGVGFMVGTIPAGLIYDAMGSYSYAFYLNAVFYLIGAALFVVLMVLRKAKRKRRLSQRASRTGIDNKIRSDENNSTGIDK